MKWPTDTGRRDQLKDKMDDFASYSPAVLHMYIYIYNLNFETKFLWAIIRGIGCRKHRVWLFTCHTLWPWMFTMTGVCYGWLREQMSEAAVGVSGWLQPFAILYIWSCSSLLINYFPKFNKKSMVNFLTYSSVSALCFDLFYLWDETCFEMVNFFKQ